MKDRILITGGAGFIGSHLSEHLLQKGAQIVCLDNFDDYYDPAIKRSNITRCLKARGYELIEGDIRDGGDLRKIFKKKIATVVHLAAMAGVRPSMIRPILYEEVNVKGTTLLLEACREAGVRKFIFASSSSVYGDIRRVPFREDDRENYPVSVYGATKKAGEVICRTYHHLYGMDMACLRFFTAYGPRQRPDMAIHKFARSIDRDEGITLFGDGSSRRDYTYIDDIVDGLLRSIAKAKGFQVYNLGESHTISLSALVRLLEKYMGRKARIEKLPPQPGDPFITCADVSKAKKLLGYRPSVGIDEGIRRFVAWYRETRMRTNG